MNDLHPPFTDEDLHRWVDRRLDAEGTGRIDAAMRTDAALAATLRALRAQRDALEGLGREWLDEPLPGRVDALLRAAGAGPQRPVDATLRGPSGAASEGPPAAARDVPPPGPPASLAPPPPPRASVAGGGRRFAPVGWPIAAALAFAAAGLGFALGRTGVPAPAAGAPQAVAAAPGFVHAALVAHAVYVPEVRHPVEVAGAERGHLVAWLSKRLGTPVAAPDLAGEGLELVGGRLLPGERGPSAQFMYQDAQGLRVTLYLAHRDGESAEGTAFRFERSGALQSFYWIDRGLGYVLSGEVPRERLSAIATAVYRSLDGAGR